MTSTPISERTRSVLKAIAWSVAFLLLGSAFSLLALSAAAVLFFSDLESGLRALQTPSGIETLISGASLLIGFLLATWIVGSRVLKLGLRELRWRRTGSGVKGAAAGFGLGAAAALLAVGAAVAFGLAYWSRDRGTVGDYLLQVLKTTAVLAPAALSEEVMCRGLPLVLMARVLGRPSALVLVAGLGFALLHGFNPGITSLALGNIALAGVFLGVAFYAPGGIWTAFGAHLGWNAMLAALDAPVSGLPFAIPLLDYHAGGPEWLSGGRFGPEGGLLATVALVAALLVALRWAKDETP